MFLFLFFTCFLLFCSDEKSRDVTNAKSGCILGLRCTLIEVHVPYQIYDTSKLEEDT